MVPLSGQADGSYDDGKVKGSSTEFFAIPHAARAGRPELAGPSGPPPAAPPIAGPVPVAAVPMGPMPVAGISGPVMGNPMMANMGGYPGGADLDGGRTQSFRVFAVVIALVMMVCAALLVTVGLVVIAVVQRTQPEPLPEVVATNAPPTSAGPVDTGGPPEKDAVKPASEPRPVKPTGPKPPSEPRPAPTPKPPSAPNGASAAGTPGTLTVRKPSDVYATSVEIVCESAGYRERANFAGDVATRTDVPAAQCVVRFKGGSADQTKFNTNGGGNITCAAAGPGILTCR